MIEHEERNNDVDDLGLLINGCVTVVEEDTITEEKGVVMDDSSNEEIVVEEEPAEEIIIEDEPVIEEEVTEENTSIQENETEEIEADTTTNEILITDKGFEPDRITIKEGDTIIWSISPEKVTKKL